MLYLADLSRLLERQTMAIILATLPFAVLSRLPEQYGDTKLIFFHLILGLVISCGLISLLSVITGLIGQRQDLLGAIIITAIFAVATACLAAFQPIYFANSYLNPTP